MLIFPAAASASGVAPEFGIITPAMTSASQAGFIVTSTSFLATADAFEAFKEKGIFDQATAQSYRENILERNGTMNSMEMYVNFRGSEPKIDPLLKNRGLDNN